VQEWSRENVRFESPQSQFDPDDEQADAIGAVDGHTLVVARAGSGKTSLAVARAIFLQEHCGISPDELLLLAFNKKAAEEIRRRLTSNLGETIPQVMTFHALAYALVHPDETIIYDDPDATAGQAQSREVQALIDRYLKTAEGYEQIRTLMMAHFREDWERIIEGGYEKTPSEFLEMRRSLPREGLDGQYYKSRAEKLIADFLLEHSVKYLYERNYWWDGRNYRPDFTIFTAPERGVIIEYFGLLDDPDYDEQAEQKRHYWNNKPDWDFVELESADLRASDWRANLLQRLTACGVTVRRLTEEEIWEKVKDRAIDRFTRAMKAFISRARKLCLAPEDLEHRVGAHDCLNDSEALFLVLAQVLYRSYLEALEAKGLTDFDGLMQRAAELVKAGQTAFLRKSRRGDLSAIRFLFVDEYQDFSLLFHNLIEAMRLHNSGVQVFCVGDDWQAINAFAGSDLSFYRDFENVFAPGKRLTVATNYRSARKVVDAGNAVMNGLGTPAKTRLGANDGFVGIADVTTLSPTPVEEQRYGSQAITPAVIRLAGALTSKGLRVVLLTRTNRLPWFVQALDEAGKPIGRQRLNRWRYGKDSKEPEDAQSPELRVFLQLVRMGLPVARRDMVTISTSHGYKGKESDAVIVLDALAGRYPLIHPDWAFTRVLGTTLDGLLEDEHRLFYVASTRAREHLIYLTEGGLESPFLGSLRAHSVDWQDYPPVSPSDSNAGPVHLVMRVGNQLGRGGEPTYRIRDHLKAESFKWSGSTPGPQAPWPNWYKIFSAENFSLEQALYGSIWLPMADGIELRICDEADTCLKAYFIDEGKWLPE
jgi:DNA helicase-4